MVALGFEPGRAVIFFSIANEPRSYDAALVRRQHVATSDSVGAARYDLPEGVPHRSVWFAIDSSAGSYAVAAPPGFPLRPVTGRSLILQAGAAGAGESLGVPFGYAEVLVIRPGMGAWKDRAGRGGSHDQNRGRTGLLALSATNLQPVTGTAAPPPRFTPADLVIIVNPNTLEFIAGHPVVQGGPTP